MLCAAAHNIATKPQRPDQGTDCVHRRRHRIGWAALGGRDLPSTRPLRYQRIQLMPPPSGNRWTAEVGHVRRQLTRHHCNPAHTLRGAPVDQPRCIRLPRTHRVHTHVSDRKRRQLRWPERCDITMQSRQRAHVQLKPSHICAGGSHAEGARRKAQHALEDCGSSDGHQDGLTGAATQRAVRRWASARRVSENVQHVGLASIQASPRPISARH
jgi:hypothetical protein